MTEDNQIDPQTEAAHEVAAAEVAPVEVVADDPAANSEAPSEAVVVAEPEIALAVETAASEPEIIPVGFMLTEHGLTAVEPSQTSIDLSVATDTVAVAYDDLPIIVFPIRFKVPTGILSDFNGEYAGIDFENGVATDYHPWRVVSNFSGGFGDVIDIDSGLTISVLGEHVAYRVDDMSRYWNYGHEMPVNKIVSTIPVLTAPAVSAPNQESNHGEEARSVEVEAVPQEGREVLVGILKAHLVSKGARFLRQVCTQYDLPSARAGEDLISILADNLTLAEANAL